MGNKRSQNRPQLADKSVLITGGAGFIGSHLADRLADSCSVTVIDNLSTGRKVNLPDGIEFIRGDIRDPDVLDQALDGIDIVFHQAALVSVDQSVADPLQSHEINLSATLNVLERARTTGARVIAASSTAIYGEPTDVPVTENQPKSPSSPYGLSKLSVDHYMRLYNQLYDLDTVALRYFNVYGSRQRSGQYGGVISIFVDQALSGGPITVHGDGTQTRDFVHVKDVVDANILAATTDHTGDAFNIGTGTEHSIMDLAETVRSIVDPAVSITHDDPRPGDIDRSCAATSKARNELNFTAEVSLQEGVKQLAQTRSESKRV